MPLRLGYKASAEQFGPVELAAFAVRAEQAGFDSVFISDHLQPWRHDGGHAPAALPWLGAVGARTERVLLGTSVLTPTFRYHPAVIAQAFATLGVLYPGRVILGVGSGESLNEVPLGLEWPDGKERFARLKEAVTLIRELWTGERVSFAASRTGSSPHRARHPRCTPTRCCPPWPRVPGRPAEPWTTSTCSSR
jgi:coenzyme F420-dependent glucose-6-phosphate dehydrogenase